jgi:hypothetical protein
VIIKLDENLGRPHVALLKRHGYDADRVFDQGLSGRALAACGKQLANAVDFRHQEKNIWLSTRAQHKEIMC